MLDKAGVLSKITSILGDNGISIKMLLQKNSNYEGVATLLLSTHKSNELSIQKAISSLCKLDVMYDKPYMIRIEE